MHLTYVKRQSDITYINEAFDLLNFSSIDLCSLLVTNPSATLGDDASVMATVEQSVCEFPASRVYSCDGRPAQLVVGTSCTLPTPR